MKRNAWMFAGLGFMLCATAVPAQTPAPGTAGLTEPTTSQATAASYIVGPQDVLIITSYDQPDLTGKFTVETDGTFTYPLHRAGEHRRDDASRRRNRAEARPCRPGLLQGRADHRGDRAVPQPEGVTSSARSERPAPTRCPATCGSSRSSRWPGSTLADGKRRSGDRSRLERVARRSAVCWYPGSQGRSQRRSGANRSHRSSRAGERRPVARTYRCRTATPSSCCAPRTSTFSGR